MGAGTSGRLCFGSKASLEEIEPINDSENHEEQRFSKMMKNLNVGDFTVDKKEKFLDNYDIGQLIGQGTLGEVRVCQNKTTR